MDLSQSWLVIGLFLAVLVSLPALVKWLKDKQLVRSGGVQDQTQIVSAVAVGPHQRVVVVEIGTEGVRTRLTLGVTPQTITCLHTAPVSARVSSGVPVDSSHVGGT